MPDRARPSARRAAGCPGLLRERAGDDDALLFPSRQRVEQARLEVERSRCAKRVTRDREIVGAFDFERAQVRIAAHHRHLEDACTRRRAAFPVEPSPSAAPPRRAECDRRLSPSSVTRPLAGLEQAGKKPQQGRLARTVRSEDADETPARNCCADTPSSTGCPAAIGRRTPRAAARPLSLIEHQVFRDASAMGRPAQGADAQRARRTRGRR